MFDRHGCWGLTRLCRQWPAALALAGLWAGGCADINDAVMRTVFPVSERRIEADLDAKHAPHILEVRPTAVALATAVVIEVHGDRLASYQHPGPGTVWLVRTGTDDRIDCELVDYTRATSRWRVDLRGAAVGQWDVHFRRADGRQTVPGKALQVRGP